MRGPRREEGAGNAGCSPHPWPACNKKSRRQSPQVRRNSPAFPARWFYGLLRTLLGEPGFIATVVFGIITQKLDTSVGVSGPHDFAVRLTLIRPRANALELKRPPHPAL